MARVCASWKRIQMNQSYYDQDMTDRQSQLSENPEKRAEREVILALLDLKPGESFLDVGCGDGLLVRDAGRAVGSSGHVCGVDSAAPNMAKAKANCPEGEFLEGDAAVLPLEDESFDAASASQLLCFVPDVNRALSELFRVLKPGGRLIILDTDWESLVWNSGDRAVMARAVALLTSAYADSHLPRSLSRRLTKAGFEITDRRTRSIVDWEARPDSFSQGLAAFLEPSMAGFDGFSRQDLKDWLADQRNLAEGGEYFFSLNRYFFSATKP
jgi:ubiquinone/menaquinone biosynthesis C-methylase UbiE